MTAKTRNSDSAEWGRLLEWCDDDGTPHRWAMPVDLLQGDGLDVRRELARQGLTISLARQAKGLLPPYVQLWPVDARARCVSQVGWHGAVYVTPLETIGDASEIVVFQSAHAIEPAFSVAGTAPGWRNSVATMAAGNFRLVYALSVASPGRSSSSRRGFRHLPFPRRLLRREDDWARRRSFDLGDHRHRTFRSWHSTINGLEGLAALHNDGLLVLDELAQVDPHQAGEAAYLLADGSARRGRTEGTALPAARWRLLGLSAGEQSLSALMAQAGKRRRRGQGSACRYRRRRWRGCGLVREPPASRVSGAFAQAIKDAATSCHGEVGLRWLTHIVRDRHKLPPTISEGIDRSATSTCPPVLRDRSCGWPAGSLWWRWRAQVATSYGLTGWPVGEATQAAERCFAVWLERLGGPGNAEERAIIDHVRAFLETHGASRFQDMGEQDLDGPEPRTINRVGFMRDNNGDREYLVPAEAFRRDICGEFDEKVVKHVLREAGLLIPGKDGKPSHVVRLPGLASVRVYALRYGGADDDPKEDATAD